MNTHRFTLEVKTHGTAEQAMNAVLYAFAARNPDGCEFHLAPVMESDCPSCDAGIRHVKTERCGTVEEIAERIGEFVKRSLLSASEIRELFTSKK